MSRSAPTATISKERAIRSIAHESFQVFNRHRFVERTME
jgi:hypothetical protein